MIYSGTMGVKKLDKAINRLEQIIILSENAYLFTDKEIGLLVKSNRLDRE